MPLMIVLSLAGVLVLLRACAERLTAWARALLVWEIPTTAAAIRRSPLRHTPLRGNRRSHFLRRRLILILGLFLLSNGAQLLAEELHPGATCEQSCPDKHCADEHCDHACPPHCHSCSCGHPLGFPPVILVGLPEADLALQDAGRVLQRSRFHPAAPPGEIDRPPIG